MICQGSDKLKNKYLTFIFFYFEFEFPIEYIGYFVESYICG